METLGDMGEHEAIRRLVALLGTHPELVTQAGDDCAVTRLGDSGFDQVLTTDPVIQGVHFTDVENPRRIGNKAAGRVLSDIAAMGAAPQWLLVNVVAPAELEFSYLEGIYQGMTALCGRFGANIIGGDLARGPHVEIHVFATGVLPSGSALLRSGAHAGDAIYVTGPLGCSLEGRHLDFIPRVEEGIFLRESGRVSSMMDISDGLATDLRHILEQSGVGADLAANQIPRNGTLEQALYDGEDFELLFAVASQQVGPLLEGWSCRFGPAPVRIGRITDDPGVLRLVLPDGRINILKNKAFEHFSGDREAS